MQRLFRYLSLALLLGTNLLAGAGGSAAAWDSPSLIAGAGGLRAVFTDGRFVVWWTSTGSKPVSTGSVYAFTVATGSTAKVAKLKNSGADFDDGVVVWSHAYNSRYDFDDPPESYGVFAMDLTTGRQYIVSPDRQVEGAQVSDRVVVWLEWQETFEGNVWSILARDIGSSADAFVIHTFAPGDSIPSLQVESGRVFWTEQDPESGEFQQFMQDIEGGPPVAVPLGLVGGGKLVYGDGDALVVWDLATGQEQRFPANRLTGSGFSISDDGRYLFTAQITQVNYRTTDTLSAYDIETDGSFTVAEFTRRGDGDPMQMGGASLAGGVLAWSIVSPGTANGPGEVHATAFVDRLPTGYRPDPGAADPNWTWYPETGHTLGWGFRGFWTGNGGLPVFGYPLTEEYLEGNQGTGDLTTVQFTERQRFEWHPENAGTPYQVLLGRLGAELLTRQGRDWTTFPRADPGTPHYMEVTGHAIAPEFWAYWSSHGLDLGDPGTSFRESLALFGYPLSEPMMETNADGDTVLTQYVERAVFEYHPNNAAPYDVLLRRLGAEEIKARGW